MSTLKTRKIKSSLLKKGFEEDLKSGRTDHHYYRYFNLKGEKTSIHTMLSRGDTEIGDPLINSMAKQLYLSKRKFMKFIECSISQEKFDGILIQKGI